MLRTFLATWLIGVFAVFARGAEPKVGMSTDVVGDGLKMVTKVKLTDAGKVVGKTQLKAEGPAQNAEGGVAILMVDKDGKVLRSSNNNCTMEKAFESKKIAEINWEIKVQDEDLLKIDSIVVVQGRLGKTNWRKDADLIIADEIKEGNKVDAAIDRLTKLLHKD